MTDTKSESRHEDRDLNPAPLNGTNGTSHSSSAESPRKPVVVSSSVVNNNNNSKATSPERMGSGGNGILGNGGPISGHQQQQQHHPMMGLAGNLSPHITTTTTFPYSRSSEIYSIAVSSLPPSLHWRQVRDLVQAALPDVHIIFTKLLGPGFGIIRVKGQANALAVTHHLNGLVLPPGYVVAATCTKEDQQAQTQAHQSQLELQLQMQQLQQQLQQQQFHQQQQQQLSPDPPGSTGTVPSANSSTPSSPANLFINPVQPPFYYPGQSYMNAPTEYWPTTYYTPHYMRRHKGPKQRMYPVSDKQRLFIGNIPYDTQWQDLKDFLRAGGNISRVDIPEVDGVQKGYATAIYHSEEDAAKAIELFNRAMFNGRELNVRYDRVAGTSAESAYGHNRNASQ